MENNNFEADNEIEIDLKELFLEIIANWKWIIISMLLQVLLFFRSTVFR